jgi:hypothetical protein
MQVSLCSRSASNPASPCPVSAHVDSSAFAARGQGHAMSGGFLAAISPAPHTENLAVAGRHSGDANNQGATSGCGVEQVTIANH